MSAATVLVLALLEMPPDAPSPTIPPRDWPLWAEALSARAIELEILDPREERLQHWEELAGDLRELRRRFQTLKDAPPLADARRLPDRRTVAELIRINRVFRSSLEARQAVETDRRHWYRDVVAETDELHRIWETIREATSEVYFVSVRRSALKRLREMLGPVAYEAGDWPPHLPWWHFLPHY